jgi:hypothetical protein
MRKVQCIFALLCSYDLALGYLNDANIVRGLSSAITGQSANME